jgi:ATP-dependent RNA helicase DeaD
LSEESAASVQSFAELGLSQPLVQALADVGYETPTPIQAQTIPLLLAGGDVIGQAQTGTGKTAAFALPILQQLDLAVTVPQALILTPTRELAIQVAEAVHTYAKHLGHARAVPIYGGDSMPKQLARLRAGVQVVVGTPGRIMDHLRRGSLDLKGVKTIVLDEADEMLHMGFLEDVEWILEQAPPERQMAFFSATMPREVRRIAERFLRAPTTVSIEHKTVTVPTVEQHYLRVAERQKLETLCRLLETDTVSGEASLIFARTKVRAAELAEHLQSRGYAVEAMHGDLNQVQRETVLRRLRGGQIEIVVATDVAARGLDVDTISRVINYDIPNDPEAYVHRVGRTARAGRAGQAILFITPREERMMREIERFTGQKLAAAKVPSPGDVAARRRRLFKDRIIKTMLEEDLEVFLSLVQDIAEETGSDMAEIAAATASLAQGGKPLTVTVEPAPEQVAHVEDGMVRLFINAGRSSGVRPADIVGAIANESGLSGRLIGAIDIYDDFALVDIPAEHHPQVLAAMADATIRGRQAGARLATSGEAATTRGAAGTREASKRAEQGGFHPARAGTRTFKGKGKTKRRPRTD